MTRVNEKKARVKKTAVIGLVLLFALTADARQPAFPGAEGAGKWAAGGRGGRVYEVTTLEDYDSRSEPVVAGSLRAAVESSGPRTVVFRISGTIHLRYKLKVTNPCLTIAGQTAPGDGVCIARYPMVVQAGDVIIRYLRFRLGDNAADEGDAAYDGPEGDGGYDSLVVTKGHNIIIDHCSASWSIDETLSVSVGGAWTNREDYFGEVTVQWCIIAESLNCSVHTSPACHGYGTLSKGGWGNQVTFHHNLYANHLGRNPYPGNYNESSYDPQGLTFDFRNNVIYNWGGSYAGYNSQAGASSVTRMNFVGNYYKRGPASSGNYAFSAQLASSRGYFADNWMHTGYPTDPWNLVQFSGWSGSQIAVFKQSAAIPVSEQVTMDDAQTAYLRVLVEAGAVLPVRDAVDRRITNDVINGTGWLIDDEDQVGGWPQLHSKPPPLDSDHDGMPDEWETTRGLNPSNPGDGNWDRDEDGYSNLEEYLHYLVGRGSISADLDGDTQVSWEDLAILVSNWLEEDCEEILAGNLGFDCRVDLRDYVVFARDWLEGVVEGTIYYVATNGFDTNPGTQSLPWRTIGKAATTMVAGDSVIVRPGIYYEQVTPLNTGLKKAPIRFIADPNGEVLINSGGFSNGFYIDSKSWIIIDGFEITGAVNEGVRFNRSAASDNTIRNCIIYDCGREGIMVYEGDRITIDNCLVYNNTGMGIKTSSSVSGLAVTHCTVYGNSRGLSLSGDGMIRDCIITNNPIGIYSSATHTITYCDVWGNTTDYSGGVAAGAGSISADPLFVSPGADFNLLPGSSCIGTGSEGNDMGFIY